MGMDGLGGMLLRRVRGKGRGEEGMGMVVIGGRMGGIEQEG
jgi:hypothetical protein